MVKTFFWFIRESKPENSKKWTETGSKLNITQIWPDPCPSRFKFTKWVMNLKIDLWFSSPLFSEIESKQWCMGLHRLCMELLVIGCTIMSEIESKQRWSRWWLALLSLKKWWRMCLCLICCELESNYVNLFSFQFMCLCFLVM